MNDHHNRIIIARNKPISATVFVELLKIYEKLSFDLYINNTCKSAANQRKRTN